MNIALEQATNLRRETNRTAVLPTAQPHAPARPALPSPPLTRHSETHRASGETLDLHHSQGRDPTGLKLLPTVTRAVRTQISCAGYCPGPPWPVCGRGWPSAQGRRTVTPQPWRRNHSPTSSRFSKSHSSSLRGISRWGLLWPLPPTPDPSAHAVWRARRGHKSRAQAPPRRRGCQSP